MQEEEEGGTQPDEFIESDKSSNINEVIRSILNFLFFFIKRFYKYKKAQNRLERTKI